MKFKRPQIISQASPQSGYLAIKHEIDSAVHRVLDSGRYVLGEEVAALESEFSKYLGIDFAVGVNSGTDALELSLRACGVSPGDVVFTVSHTAVATVAAIETVGALPVLLDIDLDTFTLSPEALISALKSEWGNKAKAVVPVHLYGHPAAMKEICEISSQFGLAVVEDCAQASGAELYDRKVGTWGDIAAFSFYPTKNLAALGDGGMVVTNDSELGSRVRMLRQYGRHDIEESLIAGRNSRLDEIQAAIVRENLKQLNFRNAKRRQIASTYTSELEDADITLPNTLNGAYHVFHQYVVRHENRDDLCKYLSENFIQTRVHYSKSIHQQKAYSGRIPCFGPLLNTSRAVNEIISLPIFPELGAEETYRVIETIKKWSTR